MSKKILVVEDDEFVRDVYIETLKDEGYVVDFAVDGQDGLLKAQEGGFDLILLDMMMPKMNGIDLLSSLKQNPSKQANGPIILLTNLAQDPVINQAMQLGAKAYLIKSDINPGDLVTYVKKYLLP